VTCHGKAFGMIGSWPFSHSQAWEQAGAGAGNWLRVPADAN
jgi:hypothetical protein